jgi:hypothetical protein
MINGYGDGPFSTLRFNAKIGKEDLLLEPAAVWYGRRKSVAGVVISSRTDKTAGVDNRVSVTLYEGSSREIVLLAQKMLEYASYVQALEQGEVISPRRRLPI